MIIEADAITGLQAIPDRSVDTCITSPPYFAVRDYGMPGQIGVETTVEEYINRLVSVFREVRRVLKDDGTLWVNMGDTYASDSKWGGSTGGKHAKSLHGNTGVGRAKVKTGLKSKDLIGVPWSLAFALRADGWYLRQDIIWNKTNAMPESVKDRCTKAHEYVFLLSKSQKYYFDSEAIKEPCVGADQSAPRGSRGTARPNGGTRNKGNSRTFRGGGAYTSGRAFNNSTPVDRQSHGNAPNMTMTRNRRSVWSIATKPTKEAHFATFPPDLVRPCVLAGSRPGSLIIDPFCGAGTTGVVAKELGRQFIGIDLNPDYCKIAERKISEYTAAAKSGIKNGGHK